MFRRARKITLLKGIFAVLTTAMLCLLGVMTVDALVILFSPLARLALSLGALTIVLVAGWWWLLRPALRRADLADVARLVEQRHPELQETVSSAVEFLSSDEPEEIRGSEELIAEVVKAAERDVNRISPKREIDARPARPWFLASLAILAVLILAGVMWPKPTLRLLWRAVAPFQDPGNAYADTLQVTPGDVRVAVGSDVTIDVSIRHPRLKRATLRRQEGEGQPEGAERMNLVGTAEGEVKRFSLVLPAVQRDFTYRVHAGNALSRRFQVRVVEPPKVKEVSVRYEFPAYTGLAAREEVCSTGEISALEHTKIRLRATPSEPVREAQLTLGGQEPEIIPARLGDAPEWDLVMGSQVDRSWEMRLRDEDGFSSEPVTGQLRSIRDQAPEMRLLSPETRELRLRPSEYLPLTYEAREDFGFSRAELIVRLEGRETPLLLPVELPQSGQGGAWSGKAGLALSDLDLGRANRLSVQLRLVDNLPANWGGGQEALSETITVRLERGAKPLVEQIMDSQEQEIRRELEKARSELQTAKSRGDEAVRSFARQDSASGLSRLEEARRAAGQAESRLQNLAQEMASTAFGERAKEMNEIASGPVRQAREKAEAAPLTDSAQDRDRQLQQMGEQLSEAINRTAAVLSKLQKSREDANQVAELARLAQEQQRLAQQAQRDVLEEQLTKSLEAQGESKPAPSSNVAAQALAAWKREQEQLQRQMAEMLRKNPEALRKAMESQAQEAKTLSRDAEVLGSEQKKLDQLTAKAEQAPEGAAAEQIRSELLKQLQAEQESIEKDTQALREELRKQYPEARDAQEQLTQAAAQGQRAAREMRKNDLASAGASAAEAGKELEKVRNEAREELAKEAIREKAKQALEGTAAQQRPVSDAVAEALDSLARQMAEKLVETPWPSAQPVSLEQKLGEALNTVKQALSDAQTQPPSGTPGGDPPPADREEALARTVAEKGREMLKRWESEAAPGQKPATQGSPVPADAEAVRNLEHLSERQESVSKTLDALKRGQVAEALAMREEDLAAKTAEVSESAQALQKTSALSQRDHGRSQAEQARAQLDQAERQAMSAARDLARAQLAQDQKQATKAMASAAGALDSEQAMKRAQSGELPPEPASDGEKSALRSSRQSQQRTGEALAQAAQRLSEAGDHLAAGAKTAGAERPSPSQPPQLVDAKGLAQSFSHVSQAMQADRAGEAASHASRAAEDLRQMAQKMAEDMGHLEDWAKSILPPGSQAGQDEQAAGSQKGVPSGTAGGLRFANPADQVRGEGVPPEMAKWGVSEEDWASLKGALDANVTEGQRAGMPSEYRGLVGEYFRALAEEARKKQDGGAEKK